MVPVICEYQKIGMHIINQYINGFVDIPLRYIIKIKMLAAGPGRIPARLADLQRQSGAHATAGVPRHGRLPAGDGDGELHVAGD